MAFIENISSHFTSKRRKTIETNKEKDLMMLFSGLGFLRSTARASLCAHKNMNVTNIDHIVLTVKDINRTVQFYKSVLGMTIERFGEGRIALKFGNQKINLHEHGSEFEPKAHQPTPGSEDLCFLTNTKLEVAIEHVKNEGVKIIEGPVARTGASGPIISFYFRDPDQNLIEVANIEKST